MNLKDRTTTNRANAQPSTRPTSPGGKAQRGALSRAVIQGNSADEAARDAPVCASSPKAKAALNHLQTGLYASTIVLPHEDPAEFQTLHERYQAFYQPANLSERERLDQLVAAKWKLMRAERLEANYLIQHADSDTAEASEKDITMYSRINQVQMRLQRQWDKLDRQLRACQATREPPPTPQPEPQKAAPKAELTPQEISWRDDRFRPKGMHVGAIVFGIQDGNGNYIRRALVWRGKSVDEFPPEAYIQEGEIDPHPPQRKWDK